MTELLFGCDAEIAQWVADRIPHVDDFGPSRSIGVVSDGRLLAGCVYHDCQPRHETIQLSMAADSPMWARREVIAGLLAYPFVQLGFYKVWTATPADGEAALKVNKHIGFTREAILAHHFGRKRHAVINRMLRPDYERLFGENHGKIVPESPARP